MNRRRFALGLVLAILIAPVPASAGAGAVQRYYALVFSNPVPGREDAFNRWYDTQHAPDVVSIPGFVSAQRYVRNDAQLRPNAPDSPRYLVVYEIVTRDLAGVYAEVNRRAADGRTRMSDTIARTAPDAGGMNVTYRATEHRRWSLPGGNGVWLHIVMANPKAGEAEALDRWYISHHAPDMAALPGFTGYQLGLAAPVQMIPDAHARQRIALFAIAAPQLDATIAAFRDKAPHMTPGPEMRDLWGFTYRPIGPRLSGDAIRKARRGGAEASLDAASG